MLRGGRTESPPGARSRRWNGPARAAILVAGPGAWAFSGFAEELSRNLWLPVRTRPAPWNYLLAHADPAELDPATCFIPPRSIARAADKRELAGTFHAWSVPTPFTRLIGEPDGVREWVRGRRDRAWCLKYPTGSGGAGHRLLDRDGPPENWPRPYVVQEWISLAEAVVYRAYAAGGQLFGWNRRVLAPGAAATPWVSRSRGARYEAAGPMPPGAGAVARVALASTGLLATFGCVDLLCTEGGAWLALEVGTDGIHEVVDRCLGDAGAENELHARLAHAVWSELGMAAPWLPGPWRPRTETP